MSATTSVFKEFKPAEISGSNVTPGFSPMYRLNYGTNDDSFKAKLKRELKMSHVSANNFYSPAAKTIIDNIDASKGLRDRVKSYTNNKKESIGVWDAIALADQKQFKVEQENKKKLMRKQHKEM